MINADLHVHTKYSMDSMNSLEDIITICDKININCLLIADHGTIDGAVELKNISRLKVIIGEEILTPFGEIMGLFLTENIPSGLSVNETIYEIKKQDGLVCIPHPFDIIRSSALKYECLQQIIDSVDIIEVFNARNFLPTCNIKAQKLAVKFNKLQSAGSDAHTISEIGNAYIEMEDFFSKDEFLRSLAGGVVKGHLSGPFVHFHSSLNKIRTKMSGGK